MRCEAGDEFAVDTNSIDKSTFRELKDMSLPKPLKGSAALYAGILSCLVLGTVLRHPLLEGLERSSRLGCEEQRDVPSPDRKGAPMIQLPGGTFEMGTDPSDIERLQTIFGVRRRELFTDEAPRHKVSVSPFFIDKYEVTNRQFKLFLDSNPEWQPQNIQTRFHNGKYLRLWQETQYPVQKGNHPVVFVSWYAAMAYAHWAGKRLPTEAEWEYAARGGLVGKQFPWGDEPAVPSRANYQASGIGDTTSVGQYPANGYGLCDMAGNVWEYCLDEWQPYQLSTGLDPVAGGALPLDKTYRSITTRRVIRGGSWEGSPVNLRVAYRDSHPPEGAGPHVGFRCVRSISPTHVAH